MQSIQRLEGLCRKAIQMYSMVQDGDSICVGMSGGKDSVALALALSRLSKYHEHRFTVQALTIDPCFGSAQTDYGIIQDFFARHDIPYTIIRSNIGHVVFESRDEKNPCALCANLRRGSLHNNALKLGCNKVALGHHLDDAVETFYMNLLGGGHIGCFAPVTWLSRKDITVIRPMVLALESDIIKAAKSENLPVVKNPCPVEGKTERANMKEFVTQQVERDPAFRQKMLVAMQKAGIDGWKPYGESIKNVSGS